MEEMMLRTAGPETYDQWVSHEIPFNDPAVVEAGNMFGDIMFTDGYVFGGPDGALTTPFADADNPMWEAQPGCWMMRQANFATTLFPEDVMADLDAEAGVFVLPPMPEGYEGTPILGAGDMAAAFVNDTDVVELMEYLGSDQFGGEWASGGGWLSPHTTFDASQYPDETTRAVFQIAADADVFRFDGSDLMPASVGAGTFWDEMNNWIGGKADLEEALTAVDESWPSS
jgi:alpha-glucoside transport system substrate-binding protein